jgi:hypothetical protein
MRKRLGPLGARHPAVLLFPGWRTEDESAAQ